MSTEMTLLVSKEACRFLSHASCISLRRDSLFSFLCRMPRCGPPDAPNASVGDGGPLDPCPPFNTTPLSHAALGPFLAANCLLITVVVVVVVVVVSCPLPLLMGLSADPASTAARAPPPLLLTLRPCAAPAFFSFVVAFVSMQPWYNSSSFVMRGTIVVMIVTTTTMTMKMTRNETARARAHGTTHGHSAGSCEAMRKQHTEKERKRETDKESARACAR